MFDTNIILINNHENIDKLFNMLFKCNTIHHKTSVKMLQQFLIQTGFKHGKRVSFIHNTDQVDNENVDFIGKHTFYSGNVNKKPLCSIIKTAQY